MKATHLVCCIAGLACGIASTPALAQPSVLLTGALSSSATDCRWVDPQSKLMATGLFSNVDILPATATTPTLAELLQYDAVMVAANFQFASAAAMGDVLADYVDAGGGVVVAVFANASIPLAGRWVTGGYEVIIGGSGQTQGTQQFLGTVHIPGHPIMANVNTFSGGTQSFRPTATVLAPGATAVADWDDGRTLVAVGAMPGRVDLGMYPPSSDCVTSFWTSSTDGGWLMANALVFAAGGGSIDPGACCMPTGACQILSAGDCASQGGTFRGPNTDCTTPCPQPAACCMPDGSCTTVLETACDSAGGAWQGGQECSAVNCPQPGGCCFNFDPCQILSEAQCASAGGTFQGSASSCATCPDPRPSTVVPQSHLAITGDGGFNTLLRTGSGNDRSHQIIWSEITLAEAGIVPGTAITGLTYRSSSLTTGVTWPPVQTTWPNYEIRMGPAAFGPTQMSTTFDANFASPPVLVRSGPLTFQPDSFSGSTTIPPAGSPAHPWGVEIGLQTPYNYEGGDLVIETRLMAAIDHTISLFVDSQSDAATGGGSLGYRTIAASGFAATTGTFSFSASPITRLTYDDATACYADCDGNETLNIDDFLCFINEFSQAQSLPTAQQITHYANCDGSTSIPVLTIDDFLCFINEFSQGCP